MSEVSPTSDEIEALVAALRSQHQRLVSLAASDPSGASADLADAIDQIGADLLVADEELRVQNEHLAQSAQRLDLLVATHEQLFSDASTALLQTDEHGIILRYNHAARRLLQLPGISKRTRALATLIHENDRPAVRALISRLQQRRGSPFIRMQPLEATLVLPDRSSRPVLLTARRSYDAGPDGDLLHWEVQDRQPLGVAAAPARATRRDATVQMLAGAATHLSRQESVPAILTSIVQRARLSVPGCDEVGVTLVRGRGLPETPAATGLLAAQCDALQYELGEGPCLGVIDDSTVNVSHDLSADQRWPKFGPRAAELGVHSALAVSLATPRGVTGALNFYATARKAFDADAELIGRAFATHAAIALANAELEVSLRKAIETRQEIGCATGILMERHRVSASDAFSMLVRASQRTNRKLREIAARVCETGEDPRSIDS